MERSRKAVVVALVVAGVAVFGYTQYASASQIQVEIAQSTQVDGGSTYDIILEFDNPSLLILTAGKTEFDILADGQSIGSGHLEPFVLPPLGSARAGGTFETHSEADGPGNVKISGTTEYDVLFASIKVPFVHYPTEDQAREFIRSS